MKNILLSQFARIAMLAAFENDGGWKMDGDKIAVQDGNPVWIGADGTESTLGMDTIKRLSSEAKGHRLTAEERAAKLKEYEGIDPKIAREAIEKLGKIDAKALIDAGEVDKVKSQIKTEYDAQLSERDKAIGTLQSKLDGLITDSAFATSKYISENIAVPVDMFRATFGKYFKVENDKLQAFGMDGNRLMSKKNIGEFADFEESIELLVESYVHKDTILKAPDKRGTGSNGNGGNRQTSGQVMRRDDFAALKPQQQAEFAAKVNKGEARLID